jgi:hypothetical protein
LKRGEVAERRAGVVAGDVEIEPLVLRREALATQVPFADMPGGVTGVVERLGQRRFFERQFLADLRTQEFLETACRGARGASR